MDITKKINALVDLIELLKKSKKDEINIARYEYCSDNNHCIIGHLLSMGGMPKEDLIHMDYDYTPPGMYSINSIIKYENKSDEFKNKERKVHNALKNIGINTEDDKERLFLHYIQHLNDSGQNEDSIIALLNYKIFETRGGK